jgi:hypothetical protein
MKKEHVTLSEADRTNLQNLIKKGNLPAKSYKRALALLEGVPNGVGIQNQ